MAKTKIVVIQMKELIYTAIFAGLGILLILLLIFMFFPSGKDSETTSATTETAKYNPGIYNSQIELGDSTLNLEVVVDTDQIKSVSFINLEDSVTTMYPLVKPSLETIEKELVKGTAIDDIPLSDKSKYTESLLIEGIKAALDKAVTNPV
ncbi:MAG: hypothetical protein J1F02_03945 [Lachnospiraceae bacterium]|nr:hypothetical protein [Lachnospiraceae bacterium]